MQLYVKIGDILTDLHDHIISLRVTLFIFHQKIVIFHKREQYTMKNEFDNVNNVCVLPLHVSLLAIYDVWNRSGFL